MLRIYCSVIPGLELERTGNIKDNSKNIPPFKGGFSREEKIREIMTLNEPVGGKTKGFFEGQNELRKS